MVSGLEPQVTPPLVDSYQLYEAAFEALTVKVAALAVVALWLVGLALIEGAVIAVPVAITHAVLLQPLLLLIRAYSVTGTVFIILTFPVPPAPDPSLFVLPSVDHSIDEPANGSATVKVTLPLPHRVWLVSPLANPGNEYIVITVPAEAAVVLVTQPPLTVIEQTTVAPLDSDVDENVELVPEGDH